MAKNRKVQSSNFVDYVKIFCASGNGGAGSVHFRREKFVMEDAEGTSLLRPISNCGHSSTLNTRSTLRPITANLVANNDRRERVGLT